MFRDLSRHPKKAAYMLASVFFLSSFLFVPIGIITTTPYEWPFIFLYLTLYVVNGAMFVFMFISTLVGLVTYAVFKRLVRKDFFHARFGLIFTVLILLATASGFFGFFPVYRGTRDVLEKMNSEKNLTKTDSDKDGKIDTWMRYYSGDKTTSIERDTNGDGKPDITEFFDPNGNLSIKYVDTNFDGKNEIQENYKNNKIKRKVFIDVNTDTTEYFDENGNIKERYTYSKVNNNETSIKEYYENNRLIKRVINGKEEKIE